MGLLGTVKRYKNRLARRFSKEIKRKQFNFFCDRRIIIILKAFAGRLEVPVYVLAEHCLELALSEVDELTKDDALKDGLSRHLVREHLLVPTVKPQAAHISRRLLRLMNAMQLLELLELIKSPEEQAEIILGFFKKVQPTEDNEE